jgi:hypothetical protein
VRVIMDTHDLRVDDEGRRQHMEGMLRSHGLSIAERLTQRG